MAHKLSKFHSEYKSRNIRIPRQYLTTEQYNQYCELFQNVAGEDGRLDLDGLHQFFQTNRIQVSRDRLQAIMSEVDNDSSGYLDEAEFMVLLIKAMAMKKRKVGPGLCPISQLRDEGWTFSELRRIGYDSLAFNELNPRPDCTELLQLFSVAELKKSGMPLKELFDAGWDGAQGREAGYTLEELVEAKCTVRRIRTAGYSDLATAVLLRRLSVDAKQMQHGGWPLSELKLAGFSATDLRLAGYSTAALSALQQSVTKQKGLKAVDRQNTFNIREELDRSHA